MYGLNDNIDLSILNGSELTQVTIGLYQVAFNFFKNVAVSVEGKFVYFDGETEWTWEHKQTSCFVAARTVALLGATIQSFERNTDGTLVLFFSNGHRLTVLDPTKEFESYTVTWPGHTVVV
jgi:hypothetical protein